MVVINGTPTAAPGTYTFSYTVTDSHTGQTETRVANVTVEAALPGWINGTFVGEANNSWESYWDGEWDGGNTSGSAMITIANGTVKGELWFEDGSRGVINGKPVSCTSRWVEELSMTVKTTWYDENGRLDNTTYSTITFYGSESVEFRDSYYEYEDQENYERSSVWAYLQKQVDWE